MKSLDAYVHLLKEKRQTYVDAFGSKTREERSKSWSSLISVATEEQDCLAEEWPDTAGECLPLESDRLLFLQTVSGVERQTLGSGYLHR
jgi:hypothetical protein